jgi:hypothetical protein
MEDVIEALLKSAIQDEAELDRLGQQLAEDDRSGLPRRSFRPRSASRRTLPQPIAMPSVGPDDDANNGPRQGRWRWPWPWPWRQTRRGAPKGTFASTLTVGLLSAQLSNSVAPTASRYTAVVDQGGGRGDRSSSAGSDPSTLP